MRAFMFVLFAVLSLPAFAACPPEGQSRESLQALKLLKFTVPDAAERQALASGLLDCLGDPDPVVRDGIAYEALTQWMRADQLDVEGLRALRDRLYAMLAADDANGFAQPFAALTLSEIARTDRLKPWMTPEERAAMVEAAAKYIESVRDYRGFDETAGWRHGVAHGADWLMQLTWNPVLDRAQLDRSLAAVATQVVPEAPHAYVFGEPGRLARPVLYAAKRGLHSEAEWQAWFTALVPRLGEASKTYKDPAWLARRHDLMAFLMSVYLEADQSDDAQLKQLKPAVVAALNTVP
ncbi:MAG: DUF2785 domain-containing protein [Lysobacter sp.]|nr:DUF2785 domain-containing protein [Lysobacter sp.]